MKYTVLYLFISIMCLTGPGCSDEQPVLTTTANADKKQIHTEEQWFQPGYQLDTLLYGFRIEYTKEGRLLDKKGYSRLDGTLSIHNTYKYDEHGNMTEKILKNLEVNNTVRQLFEYQYDDSDRKVHMKETNVESGAQYEHFYTYREDGGYDESIQSQSQDVGFKSYNKDEKVILERKNSTKMEMTLDYDDHNNLLKRVTSYNGKVHRIKEYQNEYNEHDQLTQMSYDNKRRTYEYNENGDKLKETWFKAGKIDRIINYKYTYYE